MLKRILFYFKASRKMVEGLDTILRLDMSLFKKVIFFRGFLLRGRKFVLNFFNRFFEDFLDRIGLFVYF